MDEIKTSSASTGYVDVMYRKKLIFLLKDMNLNLLSTKQLEAMYKATK